MEKSAEAFRTISEVSELLQTPAHVLRFWESRFAQVKPVKRAGGRRYYRPADLALLGGIKRLLHDDGMTIRGVQKVLREQGVRHVASLSPIGLGTAADEDEMEPVAPPRMDAPFTAVPQAAEAADETESAAIPMTLWPAAPTPEAATGGDRLLADPDDDPAAPVAAPGHGFGRDPLPGPRPNQSPPAATLLRAMDALHARDRQSELGTVYRRLKRLRDRVAETDGSGRN